MTIRIRDPFEHLVNGMKQFFTDYSVTCSVVVGFRELAKQSNQGPGGANRIVLVPATETGDAGRIVPVRDPGRRPIYSSTTPDLVVGEVRSLGDWDQNLVMSVWAVDATAPRDELAQHVAVSDLLQWGKRAVDLNGFFNITWGAVRYVVPAENTFGAELRVGFTLKAPIFDVPLENVLAGFTIEKR